MAPAYGSNQYGAAGSHHTQAYAGYANDASDSSRTTKAYHQTYQAPNYSQLGHGYERQDEWSASYGETQERPKQAAEALRSLSNAAYATSQNNAQKAASNVASQMHYGSSQRTSQAHLSSYSYSAPPTASTSQASVHHGNAHTSSSLPQASPSLPSYVNPQSYSFQAPRRTGSPAQYGQFGGLAQQQRTVNPASVFLEGSASTSLSTPAAANSYHTAVSQSTSSTYYGTSDSNLPPSSASGINYGDSYSRTAPAAPSSVAVDASHGVGYDANSTATSGTNYTVEPGQTINYNRTTTTSSTSYAVDPAQSVNYATQPTTSIHDLVTETPLVEEQTTGETTEDQSRAETPAPSKQEKKAKTTAPRKPRERKSQGAARSEGSKKSKVSEAKASAEKPPGSSKKPKPVATQEAAGDGETDKEARMRALMAQMRELNAADPALVARIWEEERKAYQTSQQSKTKSPKAAAASPSVATTVLPKQAEAAQQTPTTQTTARTAPTANMTPAPAGKRKGNTIWPQDDKHQLSIAAAKWLNDLPDNVYNKITSERIGELLSTNPSYMDLCVSLEVSGLKFDRAQFARAILAAVPSLQGRQQSQSQTQSQARLPPAGASVAAISVQEAAHQVSVSDGARDFAESPSDAGPVDTAGSNNSPVPSVFQAPVAPMASAVKEETPKSDPPKPVSKEEAARKRNFSDLIDLTQLSEEEDFAPVAKRLHHETPQPLPAPEPDILFVNPDPIQPRHLPEQKDLRSGTPSERVDHAGRAGPAPPQPQQTPAALDGYKDASVYYLDVAKAIDKKKAVRRSTYNAKTIARDVLLAIGRHPEMRPLNAHLEILKRTFQAVDDNTDLSTFRWDLVDPGEPPKYMLTGAVYNDGVEADDEGSEDEAEAGSRRQAHPAHRALPPSGHPVSISPAPSLPGAQKVHKRRGRPPRHSYPDYNSMPPDDQTRPSGHQQVTDPLHSANLPAPQPSAKPPVAYSGQPPSGTAGYSAFRQYAPDGTVIKRKGRPVGWRKAIHGSDAAKANATRKVKPKQSGNFQNSPNFAPQPVVAPSSVSKEKPKYFVYKCEWWGCKAQLHNLDTLRRHIHKLHERPQATGTLTCLWGHCGSDVVQSNNTTKKERLHFSSASSWRTHIELAHLGPIAWELGDGPNSGISDASASEAYLSDSQGRQVTPRIKTPEFEGGTPLVPLPARRGRPPKHPDAGPSRSATYTGT